MDDEWNTVNHYKSNQDFDKIITDSKMRVLTKCPAVWTMEDSEVQKDLCTWSKELFSFHLSLYIIIYQVDFLHILYDVVFYIKMQDKMKSWMCVFVVKAKYAPGF